MKKFLKQLTTLAVLGTIFGLLASYLCKTRADSDVKNDTATDDEFDLDTDLQPVTGREYVPLKKVGEATGAENKTESPA